MTEWVTAKEIADARISAGCRAEQCRARAAATTARGVRDHADRCGWKKRGVTGRGGKRTEYHLANFTDEQQVQMLRFLEAPGVIVAPTGAEIRQVSGGTVDEYELRRKQLWLVYEKSSKKKKRDAQARLDAVVFAVDLMDSGAVTHADAYVQAAEKFSTSGSSVRAWHQQWLKGIKRPDRLAALVDANKGRPRDPFYASVVREAFDSDYLRVDRPPAEKCFRDAVKFAKAQDIAETQLPSTAKTLLNRLRAEVPWQSITGARHGAQALHRTYPAQRRDHSILHALECVNGDGYRWNLSVRWPDGEICRPLMWYWQDTYSGMILAWRLAKTENAGLVRLTIGDLVREYGIPEIFVIDNTMAAASKWITGRSPSRFRFTIRYGDPLGLIGHLGARHIATLPRVGGSSKPGERAGGDWDKNIARDPAFDGAWLGYNINVKPDSARRVLTLEELHAGIHRGMLEHNSRPGRRTDVCKRDKEEGGDGSFQSAFQRSYSQIVPGWPSQEQLRLCMLAAEKVRSDKRDGHITLYKNEHWSESVAAHHGEQLIVRFDPDRSLHESVFVYSLADEFIAEAPCIKPVGFIDEAEAHEHNRRRRRFIRSMTKAEEEAKAMSALELANGISRQAEPPRVSRKVLAMIHPSIASPKPAEQSKTEIAATAPGEVLAAAAARRAHYQRLCTKARQTVLEPEELEWLAVYERYGEFGLMGKAV